MFSVNQEYTKQDIYSILNVPPEKQKGPWNTGYTIYNGTFYLFVNIGVPGRTGHDYNSIWEGQNLIWYGKTGSNETQEQIKELINNITIVQIFTRSTDRSPFTYQGYGTPLIIEYNSPIKITWKLSITPNTIAKPYYINANEAWSIFYKNISEAYSKGETFESPIDHNEYRVSSVMEDRVSIEKRGSALKKRNKAENVSIGMITRKRFETIIEKFNRGDGSYPKTKLAVGHVYIESTIVWFLPMLDWDETQKNIIYDYTYNITNKDSGGIFLPNEAKDDNVVANVVLLKRLRRGQNKLRKILLYQYSGKCCVSGCRVNEVLNACHIEPHNVNGYNDSRNALLLRSDLHDLWDMNLIGINPQTFKIHIVETLKNTEYSDLDAKPLALRKDGISPNKQALIKRWSDFISASGVNRKLEK